MKFYRCEVCGNLVDLVNIGGGKLVCCGKNMTELIPNTTDAAKEKHVPVAEFKDNLLKVQVGSTPHPMTSDHYIQFIYAVYDNKVQRVKLNPGDKPEAVFDIADAKKVEIYAYCNLHGLWMSKVER